MHPNNSIQIREAAPTDAPAISALITNSVDHFHSTHYSEAALVAWRKGYTAEKVAHQIRSYWSLVLELEEDIGGFIQFDPPEIKGFYLEPRFSGRSLGRLLFEYLLDALAAKGYQQVELSSNAWTIDFYKKFGFQLVREEVVVWEGLEFVEYRMVKSLVDVVA